MTNIGGGGKVNPGQGLIWELSTVMPGSGPADNFFGTDVLVVAVVVPSHHDDQVRLPY
jgi:hypothetical protein